MTLRLANTSTFALFSVRPFHRLTHLTLHITLALSSTNITVFRISKLETQKG